MGVSVLAQKGWLLEATVDISRKGVAELEIKTGETNDLGKMSLPADSFK